MLPSDKNYPHQERGRYTTPNLMGQGLDRSTTELTEDQIGEMRRFAPKFRC